MVAVLSKFNAKGSVQPSTYPHSAFKENNIDSEYPPCNVPVNNSSPIDVVIVTIEPFQPSP